MITILFVMFLNICDNYNAFLVNQVVEIITLNVETLTNKAARALRRDIFCNTEHFNITLNIKLFQVLNCILCTYVSFFNIK